MSTTTDLVPVERADAAVDAVERQVAQARSQAEALQVHDAASEELAGQVLREAKSREKTAEAERRELVDPLNATVKKINKRFKDALAPYLEVERILKGKVGAYQAEQERIRREEEERLERERQERERKAREERERQEAEARAKREEAEREEREARELAKAEQDEEMAALAEEAREKAQEAQTAEAALAALPDIQLPTAVVPAASKPEGISTRKRWRVKSINPQELPREWMVPDEKAINAAMREGVKENGQPPEIPGVEFEQVDELAVRT